MWDSNPLKFVCIFNLDITSYYLYNNHRNHQNNYNLLGILFMENYVERIIIRELFPKILIIFASLCGCSAFIYFLIDGINSNNLTQFLELSGFALLFFIICVMALLKNKTNKIQKIIINDNQICIKYIKDNKNNQLVLDRKLISSSRLEIYLTNEMQGRGNILYKADLFINTTENITYRITHNSIFIEGLKKIFMFSKYLPNFKYNIDAYWAIKEYSPYHIDVINNIAKTGKKKYINALLSYLNNPNISSLKKLPWKIFIFVIVIFLLIFIFGILNLFFLVCSL